MDGLGLGIRWAAPDGTAFRPKFKRRFKRLSDLDILKDLLRSFLANSRQLSGAAWTGVRYGGPWLRHPFVFDFLRV